MALALFSSPINIHVRIDERSAGFVALGLGKVTGRPAVVLTTSGTAALELHPAIAEAFHSRVPLIAVTADRPPELHGVGAPQTTQQAGVFSATVRWQCDPGVPDSARADQWRSIGSKSFCESAGICGPAGPVHLNLAFDEPLLGDPGVLPALSTGSAHGAPPASPEVPQRLVDALVASIGSRGLIVVGETPGTGVAELRSALADLAAALDFPLLVDPISGVRSTGCEYLVTTPDALLRSEGFAEGARPDFILRIGRQWASRVLNSWIDTVACDKWLVDPDGIWADPARAIDNRAACDPIALAERIVSLASRPVDGEPDSPWACAWTRAEAAAQVAIDRVLVGQATLTEPFIARTLVRAMPCDSNLFVSSSMSIREVEWYSGSPAESLRIMSNRGVNGIDGVVSTASGVAMGSPGAVNAALVGDLAFLHDANALAGCADSANLTVVVVDNGGGAIFSFLPQSAGLKRAVFDRLFTTRQDCDLVGMAQAHGADVREVCTPEALPGEIASTLNRKGVNVIVCRVAPESTVGVHAAVDGAIETACGNIWSQSGGVRPTGDGMMA